jgi:peptidyl-tRNA hydrolase
MRPAENYVLKPFKSDNVPEAEAMVKRAADALANLLVRGLSHTMNHFNS